MPSPVTVRVGCDTKFYDLVHTYARERGQNVSEVMREALVERMARDKRKPREERNERHGDAPTGK